MINLDYNITNSDWIKHNSWDLTFTHFADLLKFLKVDKAERRAQVGAVRKFVSLPVYQAAPHGLKLEIQAFLHMTASEKSVDPLIDWVFKFNENHDEFGRFASGDGMPSGWLKETPDPQLREQWKQKLEDKLVARGETREEAHAYVQSEENKGLLKYDRYFQNYDHYQKDGIKIDVDKNLTDGTKTASDVATLVDQLQTTYPLSTSFNNPTIVVTGDKILAGNTWAAGLTQETDKGTLITLDPARIEDNAKVMPEGEKMPAFFSSTVSPLEYTLTHEWGHAVDLEQNRYARINVDSAVLNANMTDKISAYGRQNQAEQFAEVFAQSYLENKYPEITKSPVTAAVKGKF